MKTLEEMQAMDEEAIRELGWEFFRLVKNNKLKEVKEFLKDYPVPEVFLEKRRKVYWCNHPIPFFNPSSTLAWAGIAYDKSQSFEMMEYFESLGLKADDECLGNNALTDYIGVGGKNKKMIDYFFKKGCKFEVYDERGATPLHSWILLGDPESVNFLEVALQFGADVNMRRIETEHEDSYIDAGETLLHIAARSEKKPIGTCLEILIKYGADVNAANCTINKTKDDKINYFKPATPLDRAISFGINKNK
ncbi:TPA: ankyrin repeat domain-containing protein, partial [Campylobacter jejuni]